MILIRCYLHSMVLGYNQAPGWAKEEPLQWQTGIHRVESASRDRTAAPAFFLVPSQNKQQGKGHLSLAVTNRRPTGTSLAPPAIRTPARVPHFADSLHQTQRKAQVAGRRGREGRWNKSRDLRTQTAASISVWPTRWHIVGWITPKWLTTPHHKTEHGREQLKWSTLSPLTRC